jgi:hypothetical protein
MEGSDMNVSEILGTIVSFAFILLIVAGWVRLLLFGDDYGTLNHWPSYPDWSWRDTWDSISEFCQGVAVVIAFCLMPLWPFIFLFIVTPVLLLVCIVRGLVWAVVELNKLIVGD